MMRTGQSYLYLSFGIGQSVVIQKQIEIKGFDTATILTITAATTNSLLLSTFTFLRQLKQHSIDGQNI